MSDTGSSNLPRIVYIHGDGVVSWRSGWVQQLHDELVAAGFPTFFELMPDSVEARAKYWLPFLEEHVRIDAQDVVLGWSTGAVAAMRMAERRRIRSLVLVAPYFTDLGLEPVRNSGWIGEPWHWQQIRSNVGRIVMFHSDDDPYIKANEFARLGYELNATSIMKNGAGHFSELESFPELSAYLTHAYASSKR